ncbi:peptide chain release factor N(5)-glutamine methyltransferase [Konateibacter massiliensis]|uniref:peptide chain release factor N(5)-glutamine methyltransferase n=1 Tax=Konateibacter massiliensis TaxID=2002841 RepID=UPI000C160B4D|nr:peptide chain release factor N(5)-glutamine methyltransferase [Konateibacter massiliensis]
MTLQEAFDYGKNYLKDKNILDYQLDAWYLLEYTIKADRSYFLLHQQEELEADQEKDYMACLQLRGNHIPLQHITKEQEFMGLTFQVNENVLIPRQDTEVLVEEVQKRLKSGMTVLDMCTGSGCIIISLKHQKSDITAFGSDISDKALEVAKENAKRNDTDVSFVKSDMFAEIQGAFDIIVSNPPYIPTEVIGGLMEEVKEHEPMLALDGKEDGLYFYREIIQKARGYLKQGGFLCFEIGHDQGEEVSALMREVGFQDVAVIKDLAGLDRVVVGNT